MLKSSMACLLHLYSRSARENQPVQCKYQDGEKENQE